jgi:hypothetical protein
MSCLDLMFWLEGLVLLFREFLTWVLLAIGVLGWLVGAIKWRVDTQLNVWWFLPTNATRQHTTLGPLFYVSIFYTYLAYLASLGFLWLLGERPPEPGPGQVSVPQVVLFRHVLLHSPGIVFIIVGALAAIWALVNTFVLIQKEEDRFEGFEEFGRRLKQVRKDLGKLREIRQPRSCYVLDYSPRVGDISEPGAVDDIVTQLQGFDALTGFRTHILTLPEDELPQVYKRLVLNAAVDTEGLTLDQYVTKKLDTVKDTVEDMDVRFNAVWQTPGIDEHHFVIGPTAGLEYVVAPGGRTEKNELRGNVTHSIHALSFLERTATHRLQSGITPFSCKAAGSKLTLQFPAMQHNLRCADLLFSESRDVIAKWDNPYAATTGRQSAIQVLGITVNNGDLAKSADVDWTTHVGKKGFGRVRLEKLRLEMPNPPAVLSDLFEITA